MKNVRLIRLGAFALLTAGISAATFGFVAAKSAVESPVGSLVKLGMKFDGAKTCAAAACHGGNEPGESPHGQNAYTLWNGKDPHRAAYDLLANDESKKIAAAAGIADATTSESCLSCHATNVPANLQGVQFAVDEGNSCTTCHGPSEKWREAHAAKGWTEGQRKANGAPAFGYEAKLLSAQGLYDTKSLVYRAERCTSCHLAIDANLIKAGHPVTAFELDYFSNPNVYQDRHWKDGSEPYFNTHQWLAGQVAAARDAFRQYASRINGKVDAKYQEEAFAQAMSHALALKAIGGPVEALAAKATALKAGDAAGAAAVATAAEEAFAAVAAYKPTKADTLKALAALTSEDLTKLGIHGVEQQAYGIFALYNAYVVTEKVAEAEANGVNESIGKLFGPLDKATKGQMDGYADALKEVAGKLPK